MLGRRLAGAETIVGAIASARANPDIDAIVLRIDSPGGSALASELMAREVFKTRGVKPIICSMGDVAASGGYFAAAGCEHIFADPMTITGSIGIFYGKFDLSGLMAKLGVSSETFRRGRRADMESMYRPYNDEERAVLHDRLTYFYGRFTGTVADGRKLTQTRVDELGRGRVWSGSQAVGIGLVDRMGGIADAIDLAKERMGLRPDDKVRVISLPKQSSGLLGLLGLLGGAREPSLGLADLPVARALLDGIPASLLVAPDSVQARLPYDIVWE
jgi:protease-4